MTVRGYATASGVLVRFRFGEVKEDTLGERPPAGEGAVPGVALCGNLDPYGPKDQILFALCRRHSSDESYAATPTPSLSRRRAWSTASYSRSSLALRAAGTRSSLATGSRVLAVSGAYSRWYSFW